MRNVARVRFTAALAAALCAAPLPSLAEVDVLQLYSSPDGEYQAILLEDDQDDGVDRFTGLQFAMSSDRGTRVLSLTPELVKGREVVVDGRRRFLVATRQLSLRLNAQAELPDAFLAVNGGMFSMLRADDSMTTVWSFPLGRGLALELAPGHRIEWKNELSHHPLAPAATNTADADFFAKPPPATVVREYYHAGLDRYMLAATQEEKSALDANPGEGWVRTGEYFRSLDASGDLAAFTVPVCRYYLPLPFGDLHFFSAFADECEAVARQWPAAMLETADAFRVALPDRTTGLCLPLLSSDDPQRSIVTVPLYRAWNEKAAGSHRYTTSLDAQMEMVLRGWVAEGYGPHGTAMCVDAYDVGTIPVPKQRPKPPRRDFSR